MSKYQQKYFNNPNIDDYEEDVFITADGEYIECADGEVFVTTSETVKRNPFFITRLIPFRSRSYHFSQFTNAP